MSLCKVAFHCCDEERSGSVGISHLELSSGFDQDLDGFKMALQVMSMG